MTATADIDRLAADLNLTDSDDRAILRQRLDLLYRDAKVSAIHAAIKDIGGRDFPRERVLAIRVLSNYYFARA